MTPLRSQVLAFHRAMGQPIADRPAAPGEDRVRLRALLVTEEFFEFLESLGIPGLEFVMSCDGCPTVHMVRKDEVLYGLRKQRIDPNNVDLPAVADALADLDYVVEGTRIEFGIDGEPIAAEVHRANLSKLGGGTRADGKITKPPGWRPPDIAGELRRQGFEP